MEKDVVFIDYDGRTVASKTITEINAMTDDTDLPANPTHEGLIAQGWNWTVAQLKAQLLAMPEQKVYVGQMYTTASGATEIDVEMRDGKLNPMISLSVNGTVTIDWGDNTTPDSVTGTSLSNSYSASHIYINTGNYTIKIKETNGTYGFYPSSPRTTISDNSEGGSSDTYNVVYSSGVKRVRIGSGAQKIGSSAFKYFTDIENITIPNTITGVIGSSSFANCYSLKSITLPINITDISTYVFQSDNSLSVVSMPGSITDITNHHLFYSLKSVRRITIPNGKTKIRSGDFYDCNSLPSITIPSSVTSIDDSAFYYCYNLKKVIFKGSLVTTIDSSAFGYCYSLSSFTIPSSVTTIGTSAFTNCRGMKEYHMLPTEPPTLSNTNAFTGIRSDCIIYVPYSADHSVLTAYQGASNWSTYASKMQEEPQ